MVASCGGQFLNGAFPDLLLHTHTSLCNNEPINQLLSSFGTKVCNFIFKKDCTERVIT